MDRADELALRIEHLEAELAALAQAFSRLARALVDFQRQVQAVRAHYVTHTHVENTAAAYTQNATTGPPAGPTPEIYPIDAGVV
jgi:multidrug resistance efflux pump